MPKGGKGHEGKTPVQKTVTREGKTHQQTFWVDPTKDQPGAVDRAKAQRQAGRVPGLVNQNYANQRPSNLIKGGVKTAAHHEHGAHAAEHGRQSLHKSEDAHRLSGYASAMDKQPRSGSGARHVGAHEQAFAAHKEAAKSHRETAKMHQASGNHESANAHFDRADEHDRKAGEHERSVTVRDRMNREDARASDAARSGGAEQSRQAAHASDAAERASIRARGSGGGPHTAQQHREAAGAHSEAARLHRVAGNTSEAARHFDRAGEHARASDMAVHHPPRR